MPNEYVPEAVFAGWMAAWADRVSELPGWRELTHYRGISAMDCGYSQLYFRVLDRMRSQLDPEAAAPLPSTKLGRVGRLGRLLRDGGGMSRGLGLVKDRLAFRWKMMMPPAALSAMEPGRSALVVTAAPNATAFPVLRSLRDECGWRLLVATWSRNVEESVRTLGVDYLHLAGSYRRAFLSLRRKHRADLDDELRRLDAADLSKLFSEVSRSVVTADFSDLVRDACLEVRVETDVYNDLFSRTAPSAVLLFNESTIRERPAARVAAQMGIKTVTLMHGLFLGYVYRDLASDRILVWGETPRQFTIARGAAPDAVISVGAFGHEGWWTTEPARAAQPARTALFLGQNPAAFISPRLYEKSIEVVCEAARVLPTVQFIVRPHPSESPLPYQQVMQRNPPPNLTLGGQGDLRRLLGQVGVVLTVFSTAGAEAMLLGTPVVVLNPVPEPPLAPFAHVTEVAADAPMLAAAIEKLLDVPASRAEAIRAGRTFAAGYFGPLAGAAKRGAVAIDSFLCSEPVSVTAGQTVRN